MTAYKLALEVEKVKGKVAIVANETDIIFALYIIKGIKDSEIDLYINTSKGSIVISDIKDKIDNITNTTNTIFEYSVDQILNPFDYNVVICLGNISNIDKIIDICSKYATPIISNIDTPLLKIA
ncbi:hypothetical protein FDN13_05370 [Caloramator sp. E03]|uniref:hypothetical protein n=1 Tax=Caloramator sp. E03 TaxID=2576307 RepID=UPI001110EC90|nr:hypothetical protein [Caloramator sp. E03]QCX33175.1 hypothetical protein FDN13_05370 [Caloramator sp. E03]